MRTRRLLWYRLTAKKTGKGETPSAMTSIRQKALFRQRVVKHALKNNNISECARLYRISRQSIHRWIVRYDGSLESLTEQSRRPHHHPNEHKKEEIERVLRVARQNKQLGLVCLWVHLKQHHSYSRSLSALYRLLRKQGVIEPPKKRKRRASKAYEPILVPGERVQVDVKYVPKESLTGELSGRRLYQYTAIDECTRWRYTAVFSELSTYNSTLFVAKLRKAFPFEIACIQTDNGVEFTSFLKGARKPSLFEAYLEHEGIRHKRIAPATPRHNGKVERSHRTDEERFYRGRKFFSLRYLKEQMSRYLRESNRMPLSVHNWKSAQHMLESYQHVL